MEVVETSGLISIHETGTITNYIELIREYHGSLNQLRAILDSKSDIIDKLREEIKILKEGFWELMASRLAHNLFHSIPKIYINIRIKN